jgi:hypothetical protein
VEEAVEAEQNGMDGTCEECGNSPPKASGSLASRRLGVDTWNVRRWRDGL